MIEFSRISGFDWDDGNSRKTVRKHGVSQAEAEQVFFNEPLLVVPDMKHGAKEPRFHALGHTDDGRLLHISFSLRSAGTPIRVISARTMSRKEKTSMSKKLESTPRFATEAEERTFREQQDSTDHVDWSRAEHVRMPNLKPSSVSISLRLPVSLLERIKIAANKRDMPYQSLIKAWLAEKVDTRP